ncbi:MAG: SAM-dependent methyltransferase [Chloroflexota bacterium]|nr:SAM-dependent methyltransferase [Chloroflexota bacterium]
MPKRAPRYTAEGVAAWLAAGAREKDECVRNPDYLAVKFLGTKYYLISQFPPLVKLVLWCFQQVVPGGYYFHIARTKHIDVTRKHCLAEGLDQLVVLGAGYDSRAYRFRELLGKTKVFEVDHPGTQEYKKLRLARMYGTVPQWVTFVAMDFNKERLEIRLPQSGYDPGGKTFFIWEGVCMYISPAAVDMALSFVARHSGAGSSIVFDFLYRSVIEGTCDYYGAREAARYVARVGEPYVFGIEEGDAARFLEESGFELVSELGPEQLQKAYLIRGDGSLHGRVYGYTGIAHARVKSRPGSTGADKSG